MFTNDWALSKAFSRLEAVELCKTFDPDTDFFLDLKELSGLVHLSASGLSYASVSESTSYPSGLTSLELIDDWSDQVLAPLFVSCQHLTDLSLCQLRGGTSLSVLTGLKALAVETIVHDDIHDVKDWTNILIYMPQLEYLELKSHCNAYVPSLCLLQLQELASLSLDCITVDGDFFFVIGVLRELTELKLIHCIGIDSNRLSEINRLTNLQSLWLIQSGSLNPCSYIENGVLSKVRELRIPASVFSRSVEEELFARLPCLRRLQTYYYYY